MSVVATDREQILPRGAGRDGRGRLTIGGCAVADVAAAAGTPALIVDEGELRATAREYARAFASRWPRSTVYFASKALSCSEVIRVFAQEGLGCDVASAGELAIALAGGMPAERILLHGNAKRDLDLVAAIDAGVGLIVVDSLDELDRLQRLAPSPQRLLLRVNPSVSAPTHEAMATGHEDSKFGLPLDQLREAVARIERAPMLALEGLHAHIGSQILALEPFERCARELAALSEIAAFATFDLGGGLGVRYLPEEDEPPSVDEYAERLIAAARAALPAGARIIVEPGRSLVARAMVTAYRVVSVKRAARTFVSVDRGMADNLEPMMYGTPFAPFVLDAARPAERCDVVGPHCETGDWLVQGATLASPQVDDLVVVPMTGAYCYALANNYNGACRPPVVLCAQGRARVVQRRETIEDLLARNCDAALGALMAAIEQVCELLSALVACDSSNPSLSPGGAGESAVAQLVAQRLQRAGLRVETWEQAEGRLGVLGVLPGAGGGERLLLCSHLDVVASDPEGFVPDVRDGRMYGRGTSDMKGGLAASILAAAELAAGPERLRGDLLVAGVIDEEWLSAGAVALAERLAREGLAVAGAVLPEATGLDVIVEHGGFAWWELVSEGCEAAGDDPERGIDAIALAGRALTAVLQLDAELAARPAREYGRPGIHAATIAGGRQLSAYPGSCSVGIERCTIPGETVAGARAELQAALDRCMERDPRARYRLSTIVGRDAISLPASEPVVEVVARAARARLGERTRVRGDMGWMDSGVLVEAGIPCVAFGPLGDGEHTAQEWVDLQSVCDCAAVLVAAARELCGVVG